MGIYACQKLIQADVYVYNSLFEGTKTSISLYFHFTLMENIKSRGWCDSEPFICFHPTCWLGRQSNCFQLTAVLDFDSVVKLLEATYVLN